MAHSQSGGHRNKADRREDIEQNLAYELSRFSQKSGKHISFNKEARERFLTFALDPDNRWPGNFRDLNAMVVRMATPSDGRRSPALLYRLWVPLQFVVSFFLVAWDGHAEPGEEIGAPLVRNGNEWKIVARVYHVR